MSVNKSFIVKKGIEVSNDLIFANDELNKVGIGSTVPKGKLDISGDTRTKDLNVSGIATISIITGTIGTVTNLTGTNINYTGIGTFANLVGTSGTVVNIVGSNLNYGIGTFIQLNSDRASLYENSGAFFNYTGFGTVTNLRSLSGIVTNLSGTNLNYADGTFTNLDGTSATITNLTGTSGTVTRLLGTNLNFSGIGTINNVRIVSGIVTAVSGIITFYGDGSNLTSVKPVPAGAGDREVQFNISGVTTASSNLKFVNDNELLVGNRVTSQYIGVGTVVVDNSLSVGGFTTFFSFGNKFLEITPTQNTIQLYSQNYQNERRRWLTYPFKPYIHTLGDLSTKQSLLITEIDWVVSNYPVTTTSTVGTLQDNSGFTTSITAAYGYNTDTDIVLHNRLFLGGRHPRASDDDECGLWISPGGILGDGNNAENSSGPIANRPVIDTYFGDDTTVGSLSARMRLSGYVKGAGSNGAEFASINFDSQISPDNQFNFQRGKAKIWAKNVIDLTNPKAQYGSSLVFGASKLGPQNSGQNSSTYSDILEIRGDDYLRLLPNVTGIQFGGTQNAINYDGANIRIITNSTERISFTSSGRIGIGTTIAATSTLVSIAGSFGFSEPGSNGSRTRFTTSSAGFVLNHDDNSNLFFQTQGLTRFRWDHNAIAFIIGSIQPTGTANQRFQVEGGAYFQNGVGIGTTNPGESLEVAGNIRVGSSSTQNYIAFRGTTGDNQPELGGPFNHSFIGERIWDLNTERSELVIIKTNDPGGTTGPDRIRLVGAEIKFDTYTTGYAGSFQEVATSPNNLNRLVIKSDGTIGIGTETTKALLDVRGQATFGEGVVPAEMGWGKDTNERVYSFSGAGGANPSQGTIALVSPNVNPSATRVGGLVFGNRTGANPATSNPGIKASIETFTYANVANASDTGGYLNVRVKPNAGNLYTIATFDSSKLQVFGDVESSRLISNVANGTSPLVVSSTTQVNNLNSQYVNGKSVGTSGNTIPLLDGNNTWSGLNTFNREVIVVTGGGTNSVSLGEDGNIEIRRGAGGAYIDFKDANEDFDIRVQRTGDDELSIIGGQLTAGRLRMTDDSGIDGGKTLFFGREESFFGSNIGGNDYGYIIWDNDNNDYAAWGDSTENGCLRIGTENDGDNAVSDSMALEPVADLWLYPRLGRVHFHKKNSSNGGQRVFTGLESPSNAAGRGQFVLSSAYSDLVIASSQSNSTHGSTLTFATYSPSDSSIYRKFVINQGNWGSRAGFLEFGYSDANGRTNPHSNINDTDTVLTLDGYNKRVGIGRRSPGSTLDVLGESRFTADNAIVATGTNPTDDVWGGSIEIREINQVLNTNTASAYAPAITFHWGNVASAAIKMYSDGSIRFTAQGSGGTSYRPIYASQFISNIATGNAPLVVSSTTKVNNLNADLLDGYDSSNFINSTHTGFSAVPNRPVGWYTIAVNAGDRAVARFGIKDVQSSQHQSVIFYASHKFGNNSELTVLHGSRYSGNPFRYIRIKEGSTYDGALLQVYIDDAYNAITAYLLGDNFQDGGWVLKNWVPDAENPGGVANFGALTNTAAQIDIDQILDGGMATTGDIYAGGQIEQFRVLTTNDLGPAKGLNADLLDSHDWMSAGKSISGTEVYAENWFRNMQSGEGLYNEQTAMHWYSDASWRFRLYSTSSASSILFATAGNNPRGYVYADTASSIGFLNTGGEWGLRYLSNDGLSPNLYFLESGNESWSGDPGSDVGKIEYHSNRFYIASGDNSTEIARFRRSGTDRVVIQNDGTTLINGNRVLTTADSTNNTINAVTLGGTPASGFLRSDSGDTYEGQSGNILTFRMVDGRNAGSSSGSLSPLEIYQNSNTTNSDAFMTFHIGNRFATYFGLDRETNDLFTGGWSDGTAKHKIWHAGNHGVGSGLSADFAGRVSGTAANGGALDLVYGNMAANDQFRIRVGGSNDGGYVEIATADNGTEPIYVTQYEGVFSSVVRSAVLLDGNGNTYFPGAMTLGSSLTVSSLNGTGGGIILSDDGDIVDLNDGYAAMRFSNGVRVHSGNRQGGSVITLASNGIVYSGESRSSIFYDNDNTAFYINPASDGTRSGYLNGNLWINPKSESYAEGITFNMPSQNTWGGLRWYRNGAGAGFSGNWAFGYFGNEATNDIGFHNGINGWRLDHSFNMTSVGSVRTPILYDSNDTGYYLDPNSTSDAALRIRGGALHGPNPSWGAYLLVGGNGRQSYINSATASVCTTNGNLHLDAGSGYQLYLNHYDGTAIYFGGGDNNNWGEFSGGVFYAYNQTRSPIFYDYNNTGYYVDPNSTTQLHYVLADNWFRPQGNTGLYFQSYGRGLWSPESEGNNYGNVTTYGGGRNGWQGWGIGSRHCFMSTGGDNVGVHDNSRGWIWYWNGSYTSFDFGYTQFAGSARAPIFYDSNNTGYYVDPNSDRTTNINGFSSYTVESTKGTYKYNAPRYLYTGDTNYWTGIMGWGTTDMNSVFDWGSGFIDSWSNPGNQPSGSSHWVGVQAVHYTNNNERYGWQMVGGQIGNLRFRNTWGGFSGWTTVAMHDRNDSSGGALYAGIYYDSNDSGYYCDPTGTSRLSTINCGDVYNDLGGWFRNYNATGIYNQTYGTHFYSDTSNVWNLTPLSGSSAVALRLRSAYGGSILGYYYGETNGYSGILNTSGNWRIRVGTGDAIELFNNVYTQNMFADVFYDRNNSGFFLDPASGGDYVCARLAGVLACNGLRGRRGLGGSESNNFNFHWSNPIASVWVDYTRIGTIATLSDYRIKRNIKEQTQSGLEKILKLRPVTYQHADYKTISKSDDIIREGFIAHELQEVIPSAVDGQKDSENELQSLNFGPITSVMVKAIQELTKKLESLEEKVNSLL